jgi:type IV pilus assembly protein PilM
MELQLTRKREKSLVGLEIESGSVAATEVRANGSARVTSTAIAPLPLNAFRDGEVADPEALTEGLKALYSDNKLSKKVRIGIANQRVVVRTLRLPAIEDPKELEAAVRFQAQEQVPMPLDQAVLDHRVVGGVQSDGEEGAPKIDVVVVAARRDMIEATLAPVRKAGLQPVGVDLSAFGMIRALGGSIATGDAPGEKRSEAVLYANIGDSTNLAVAKGRSCLFTRVAPVGIESIVASLGNSAGLTPDHARMWLDHVGLGRPVEEIAGDPALLTTVRKSLEAGASSLRDELRLSLDFYGAQESSVPIGRIVLCGPGSTIPGLPEQLESSLNCPFEVGRPEALADLDAPSAARLTLAYGLALED